MQDLRWCGPDIGPGEVRVEHRRADDGRNEPCGEGAGHQNQRLSDQEATSQTSPTTCGLGNRRFHVPSPIR